MVSMLLIVLNTTSKVQYFLDLTCRIDTMIVLIEYRIENSILPTFDIWYRRCSVEYRIESSIFPIFKVSYRF